MGATTKAPNNKTQKITGNTTINSNFSNTPDIINPSLSTGNSATYTRAVTTGLVTVINGGASPIAHNIPATENGKNIILLGNTGLLSATATVYTNFLWISATSFSCVDPVKTATSGTLKTNNAITTIGSVTIPGGLLGSLGSIDGWVIAGNNDSAGVKNVYVDYGASLNVLGSISVTITTRNISTLNSLKLINAQNQILSNGTLMAINTTINQNLAVRAQCVAVNDYVVVNSYVINISKIG